MKSIVLGVLGVFMLVGQVYAQPAAAIVSRDVGYFNPGVSPATGGQPFQVDNYTVAQTTCGVTPKATAPGSIVINPTEVRIDDPANPTTADCSMSIGTRLNSIPVGTDYRAAVRARGTSTVSAWSGLSNPFAVEATPPAVPTGTRVR